MDDPKYAALVVILVVMLTGIMVMLELILKELKKRKD